MSQQDENLSVIEYVVNRNNAKFICLSDMNDDDIENPEGQSLLINHEGKKARFDNKIFEPKYYTVTVENAESLVHFFESVQIQKYKEHVQSITRAENDSDSDDNSGKKSWYATRLTFYKKEIEPLRDDDEFEIEVKNVGTFVFTKAQFKETFSNVVDSYSYQELGIYHYKNPPKKADPYLKVPKAS